MAASGERRPGGGATVTPSIDRTRWLVLSPLLDELLDMDPAQRDEHLEALRLDDPSLAEELASLLAADAAARLEGLLEGSPLGPGAASSASLSGRTIGAYTLERLIGQGGMGSVWLARRSDGRFEGKVAIKFLSLALLSRGGAERFEREGRLLARLAHERIARLIDAGVADGQPYLVLEYVEGESIDRWCDLHRLDVQARIRLFLDVLAAVSHAHSNLILHRDLKPSNILVTHDGSVKLLDFGIAKLVHEESHAAEATELTRIAGRAYTPAYAAPEQLGDADVTTATDVYALGVLFYALLVGRHPTADPTQAPVDQLRAVLESEPLRLSHAAQQMPVEAANERASTPLKLARELRGDLDNIAAKALKKTPNERYATAAEFADDLRRYLQQEPVRARPDSLGYRMGKFVRRHRIGVGAVAAILVALVGGIVGTTWQTLEARRTQRLAEANAAEARAQRETAQFEARVARANHEFVSQLFGDAMRDGDSSRTRAQLDRARELLRKRYADDPVVHALLLFQLAGRYAELFESQREADVLREVEALSARANDPSLRATMACIKAYDLIRDRDVEAARPYVAEGLRLMQVGRALSTAGFECYRADAMLASATGEYARGVAQMQRWLGQLERDGLEKTRLYLNSLASLVYIHQTAGELVPALVLSRRVRKLNEDLGSEATLSSQVELERQARLLLELGRMSEAIEVDAELLRRFAGTETGGAPAAYLITVAQHELVIGSAAKAEAWLASVLPKYEHEGPELYARGVMLDLASAYAYQGRYMDAESMLQRFRVRLGAQAPTTRERVHMARVAVEIALGANDADRLGPAIDALEGALAAPNVPRIHAMQGHLAAGEARLAQKDADKARSHGEHAMKLATAKTIDKQASAWVGGAELLLAQAATAAGDRADARRHLASASEQFADALPTGHRWRAATDALSAAL